MKRFLCTVLLLVLNISLYTVFAVVVKTNAHQGNEDLLKSNIEIGKENLRNVYVDSKSIYWLSHQGNYSSFCIPKSEFEKYSYITVEANSKLSAFVYILKSEPKDDGEQVYFSNYYCRRVPVGKGLKLDILIPPDAEYIIIPHKTEGKNIRTVSVNLCTTEDVCNMHTSTNDTLSSRDSSITSHRFVHWNIGHFSKGKYPYSTISKDNYAIRYSGFKNFINNYCFDCHILLNEYDETFANIDGVEISTDTVLFDGTKSFAIFPRSITLGYNKLAAFWKDGVLDFKYGVFESLKGVKNQSNMLEYGTGYSLSHYSIGESDFYVMSLHGPTSISKEEYKAFFMEILEICSEYKNIILVGDFNRPRISDLEVLTDAGFSILNDKSKTCPGAKCIFDWVLYRCNDVILSDFKVYTEAVDSEGNLLSDHLPLSFTVTYNNF